MTPSVKDVLTRTYHRAQECDRLQHGKTNMYHHIFEEPH
jgi:hypothetical protein